MYECCHICMSVIIDVCERAYSQPVVLCFVILVPSSRLLLLHSMYQTHFCPELAPSLSDLVKAFQRESGAKTCSNDL